jgi:hypothetical protein
MSHDDSYVFGIKKCFFPFVMQPDMLRSSTMFSGSVWNLIKGIMLVIKSIKGGIAYFMHKNHLPRICIF